MNGLISSKTRFVIDTNVAIDLTVDKITALYKGLRLISIVTEMELLAYSRLTPEAEQTRIDFLESTTIIPLDVVVKNEAIRIRRFGSPRLKLPDAIIAASAVILDATLVTNDETILRLDWPGFAACSAL